MVTTRCRWCGKVFPEKTGVILELPDYKQFHYFCSIEHRTKYWDKLVETLQNEPRVTVSDK